MDVPGYQGMLVARFGPLPWDVVERAMKEQMQRGGTDATPAVAADALAHAVVGFFYRPGGDDPIQPLEYPEGTPVVRFDKSLAEALGITHAETAREIIYALYLTGEAALIYQYNRLMDWTVDRDYAIDEDVAVEASEDPDVGPLSVSPPVRGLSG